MATINWNQRADATPPVQGGLDGGKNHVGHFVKGYFRLSELKSGAATKRLKLPAGVIPKNWGLFVVENGLKAGKSTQVHVPSVSAAGTDYFSGALSGATASASGVSAADPTPEGLLAAGAFKSGTLVAEDASGVFLEPVVTAAITPETDGDAILELRVGVDVVDKSKVYLW